MSKNNSHESALYQDLPLEQSASQIASYLRKTSNLPRAAQVAVMDAAKSLENCVWVDSQAKNQAKESVLALLHSMNNQLTRQSELHAKDVTDACNFNNALRSVTILETHNPAAKLFAMVDERSPSLEVKGQGFEWWLTPIEQSDKPVPREYLEDLSLLRQNNLFPDSMYIGVPYVEAKPGFGEVLTSELVKTTRVVGKVLELGALAAIGTINAVTDAMTPMPDPLLICGFGNGPVYLVQIGKWE